jgi:hypothetical protein
MIVHVTVGRVYEDLIDRVAHRRSAFRCAGEAALR